MLGAAAHVQTSAHLMRERIHAGLLLAGTIVEGQVLGEHLGEIIPALLIEDSSELAEAADDLALIDQCLQIVSHGAEAFCCNALSKKLVRAWTSDRDP